MAYCYAIFSMNDKNRCFFATLKKREVLYGCADWPINDIIIKVTLLHLHDRNGKICIAGCYNVLFYTVCTDLKIIFMCKTCDSNSYLFIRAVLHVRTELFKCRYSLTTLCIV